MSEKLAELFDSEDVHVLLEFAVIEASMFFIWFFVRDIINNDILLNGTASDSWTSRAKILRVPGSASSVVISELIHVHCPASDGRVSRCGPEGWFVSILEMPPVIARSVTQPRLEDTVVMEGICIIITVDLTCRLQVIAGAAAISAVPVLLVDGEAVVAVRVR